MAVHGGTGMVTVGVAGSRQEVSAELLDSVGIGDYVLIDVGFAVAKIDARKAEATLETIAGGDRCDAADRVLAV